MREPLTHLLSVGANAADEEGLCLPQRLQELVKGCLGKEKEGVLLGPPEPCLSVGGGPGHLLHHQGDCADVGHGRVQRDILIGGCATPGSH